MTIFYMQVSNEMYNEYLLENDPIRICVATNNINLPPLDCEMALVTSDGSTGESVKKEALEFDTNDFSIGTYDEWIKEILVVSSKVIYEERRDAFLPQDTLTIRCRLQQRDVDCSASEEGFAATSIEVRKKLFIWTLNGINSKWTDMYEYYLFSIKGTYGYLKLKALIKGEPEERLFVEVHRDKGNEILSILKISLLDAHGTERQLKSYTFFLGKSEQRQVYRLPSLISKKELLALKNRLLPNDTLSLKCDFTASLGLVGQSEIIACPRELISSSNYYDIPCFSECQGNGKLPSRSLQSDLKCILDTGSLSDFELRVDSDVFPVHKSLLGARSPVFNAMFTNDCKETSSGHVLISDISADSIRRFLIYLYTDRIEDLTIENATELYFAADKYGVLCLKEICASFLKANLSSSSACAVLVLADRHRDKELKSAVRDFISKNDSEILRSEDWQDLEKSNYLLALETLRDICLKKSTK